MANLRPVQDAGSQHGSVDLPSYISGYVDGEGCFSVSISPRPTLIVGWEVRPSLSVSQNGDRSEVLLDIQRYFGCGSLRPDRSDRTLKWEVRSLPLIVERSFRTFANIRCAPGSSVISSCSLLFATGWIGVRIEASRGYRRLCDWPVV